MDAINTNYLDRSFMDPASLQLMLKDESLSPEQKKEVIGIEFEKILLKEQLSKAFESPFSEGILKSGNEDGYGALITELLAHSLAQGSPLGISNVLQVELQKK